jgi:hypothetical protein
VYVYYEKLVERFGIPLLRTSIPRSLRYDREQSIEGKLYGNLFPAIAVARLRTCSRSAAVCSFPTYFLEFNGDAMQRACFLSKFFQMKRRLRRAFFPPAVRLRGKWFCAAENEVSSAKHRKAKLKRKENYGNRLEVSNSWR